MSNDPLFGNVLLRDSLSSAKTQSPPTGREEVLVVQPAKDQFGTPDRNKHSAKKQTFGRMPTLLVIRRAEHILRGSWSKRELQRQISSLLYERNRGAAGPRGCGCGRVVALGAGCKFPGDSQKLTPTRPAPPAASDTSARTRVVIRGSAGVSHKLLIRTTSGGATVEERLS